MAKEIECSINALGSDISSIKEAYEKVINSKNGVKSEVDALNGMWQGSAHDVFIGAFENDYEKIETLCKTLKDIIEKFDFAKSEYSKCESEVGSIISNIKV